MTTSKRMIVLLSMALAGTAAHAAAAPSETPQQKPSNAFFAKCIVKITVSPAILPLSSRTIEGLVYSSAIAPKACRDVLAQEPPEDTLHSLVKVQLLEINSAAGTSGGSVGGYGMGAVGGMGAGGGMAGGTPLPQESQANLSRRPDETDIAYRVRIAQFRSTQRALAQGAGGGETMGGYGGGNGATPSAMVELQISLPDKAPAGADELLQAVVKNLRDSLSRAHVAYQNDVETLLAMAKDQRRKTEEALDGAAEEASPATMRIRKQLDTEVDLSVWTRQTEIATAVEILRKSVDPPLNIIVLWRDVESNLSVTPASPINIDGAPRIRLGTALDLLVKGFYDASATAMWRIRDDTIVIGTRATLEPSLGAMGQPKIETDVADLGGQRSDLTRKVQALELDLAGIDARRDAIVKQVVEIEKRVRAKRADDPVLQELEKLTLLYTKPISTPDGRMVSPGSSEGQENLVRARIQLANRREELSRQAGGGQLEDFNKELNRLVVDKAEKEAQLRIVREQLDEVQKQLTQALTSDPEAARLRLARESLDSAARRITELQTCLANLQPPMVTVIGAN